MHGNTTFTEKLVELVVVDATSGELTEVRALPWYLKFTMLSEPLHFGNYGGLFLKLVWLTLSLVSLALPILGIYIWQSKKRSHKVDTKKSALKPWLSQFFKQAYLAPGILFLISAVALVGSFFTQGLINQFFVALLFVPLYFIFKVLVSWLGQRS
jgi:uncharacterized iron-regulated membrane protein